MSSVNEKETKGVTNTELRTLLRTQPPPLPPIVVAAAVIDDPIESESDNEASTPATPPVAPTIAVAHVENTGDRPLPETLTAKKKPKMDTYARKKEITRRCREFMRERHLENREEKAFKNKTWYLFQRKKFEDFTEDRKKQYLNYGWFHRHEPFTSKIVPTDFPLELPPEVFRAYQPQLQPPLTHMAALRNVPGATTEAAIPNTAVPLPLPPQQQPIPAPIALRANNDHLNNLLQDRTPIQPPNKVQRTEERREVVPENRNRLAVPDEFTPEQIESLFRQSGLGESGKYCPICLETKEQTSSYNESCSDHCGCRECVIDLLTNAIKGGSLPPSLCPGCHNKKFEEQNIIDPNKMLTFLLPLVKKESDEYFAIKKWAAIQLKSISGKEVSENQCPECGCTSSVSKLKGEEGMARCGNPTCALLFCNKCGQKKHTGRTCSEYNTSVQEKHKKEEDETTKYLQEASKPCPKCGLGIQHFYGHGCHHMTCPKCRYEFCYVCMEIWKGVHNCAMFCGGGRCKCIPCLECKINKPCAACPGCNRCLPPKPLSTQLPLQS